jgi:alpha-L-fucosidase
MSKIFSFLLVLFGFTAIGQDLQPTRPANFTPYHYKYSVEKLSAKFSSRMMKQAQQAMNELEEINHNGKYQGTLKSLELHETPDWYLDGKLGVFFDWGLYSVAGYATKGWSRARYPDWYLSHMLGKSKSYHEEFWGEDFRRDDFIGLFTAGNFSAEEVVSLASKAGAKYFVPFSKHHDGYCLWDSKYTHRDAADMNPGIDISQRLVEACEKAGLRHGFYFSVEDYEYPILDNKNNLKVRIWSKHMAPDNAGIAEAGGEIYMDFNSELHNGLISGKIAVNDFVDDYLVPQAKDYIDQYEPDILWFDGEWQRPAEYYRTPEIVAYFYNKNIGKKEVVANDRMGAGTREQSGDFYTSETDEVVRPLEDSWEENRSMSESYGYNWSDSLNNYLNADQLIEMFVRIVAKGGNLNLIVNPDGTGKVPEIQKNLLHELGKWLKVNGEAIYGSRTYEVASDNTQLGQPVWYTRSKDGKYGYAICFEWPMSETFICTGANPKWDTEVYMLGFEDPLEWVETPGWGLTVKIPEEMLRQPSKRPSEFAWVLRFEWDKLHEYGVNRNELH